MENSYKGKTDKRYLAFVDLLYDATNEFKNDDGKVDDKSRNQMLTDLSDTINTWLKESKPKKKWFSFR